MNQSSVFHLDDTGQLYPLLTSKYEKVCFADVSQYFTFHTSVVKQRETGA